MKQNVVLCLNISDIGQSDYSNSVWRSTDRSELQTNISDVFAVERFQNLSGYRNSFYPHQNLMASLNGEHPSETRMI